MGVFYKAAKASGGSNATFWYNFTIQEALLTINQLIDIGFAYKETKEEWSNAYGKASKLLGTIAENEMNANLLKKTDPITSDFLQKSSKDNYNFMISHLQETLKMPEIKVVVDTLFQAKRALNEPGKYKISSEEHIRAAQEISELHGLDQDIFKMLLSDIVVENKTDASLNTVKKDDKATPTITRMSIKGVEATIYEQAIYSYKKSPQEAERKVQIYRKLQAASSETILEALRNGEIDFYSNKNADHTVTVYLDDENRNKVEQARLKWAGEIITKRGAEGLLEDYKNGKQVMNEVLRGEIYQSPEHIETIRKAESMIYTYKHHGKSSAEELYQMIKKGQLEADPNSPRWKALYEDGNPTQAQKDAYQMWRTNKK
jgi:hypothetical protein